MKAQTAPQKDIKTKAQNTLLDALGAVSAAIAAMPDNIVPMPRNLSEAFMLGDPILSSLNKQILDARANLAQLVAAFGPGDAMAEALTYQLGALEKAFNERMALLRKKREEQSRKKSYGIMTEEKKLQDVRPQPQPDRRQHNGALWLLAILMLRERKTSAKAFGHVPNAA